MRTNRQHKIFTINSKNGKVKNNETDNESTVLSGGKESIRRKFKHTHTQQTGFQQNCRENMKMFGETKKQAETKS